MGGHRTHHTLYRSRQTRSAIWWGCCRAIALKKQKRVIIAELDLQKFDVVYDASSYEACDRLGIKYQMHQHFAVSSSELLVFGIDETHLTKRLLLIDPEYSVQSKIVLGDVCPKDREVDPATGELVHFGGFRKYLEAFEAKYPTKQEQQSIIDTLTIRQEGSAHAVPNSRGRIVKDGRGEGR